MATPGTSLNSSAENLHPNEGTLRRQNLRLLSLPALFLALIFYFYVTGSSAAHPHPQLTSLLGMIFTTSSSFLVAFLAGRSFLSQAVPNLLMLTCGALILGAGSVVSTAIDPEKVNDQVAVYNICILFSAVCHLTGAAIKPKGFRTIAGGPMIWLGLGCFLSLLFVWIVKVSVVEGLVPPFFVQGHGGTPLRQIVLITAIGMFVASGILLNQPKPGTSRFNNWYALALYLIAIGLFGVLLQQSQGSLIGWTGRTAQYLGGVFMLVAAVASIRESRAWRITIEAAWREAKTQYEGLFDLAADGVMLCELSSENTPSRILQANKALCILLGYTAVEMQTMALPDIAAPEDREPILKRIQKIDTGGSLRQEGTFITKDGRRVQVELSQRAFVQDRRPLLMSIVRDCTERKQSEVALQRLSQFPEQNPAPVLRASTDGGLLYANEPARNWLKTLNWSSGESLPVPLREVVVNACGKVQSFQSELCNPDRTVFWVSAIQPPGEEFVNLYAIDITERKEAEAALRQLNADLEQRVTERTVVSEARAKQLQVLSMELVEAEERERQRIAQLLHEDLQQILAAARIQLQTACHGIQADPVIQRVGQLLEESISKARRLSRELSPAVLQHSTLFAALQWLIGQIRDQFGLHVQLQSDNSQGFVSDPLKIFLFRGVQELLFNVVKHAKVQSASVVLSNCEREIAIEVSDRGRGFDPDILNTTTKKVGLGLLGLRERCRYIGGSFVIESSPGLGSRITLTVPRGEELQQLTGGQPLPKSESPPPAPSGITRLLIVDDHQVMRSGLVRLFREKPGIQIVGEAANGREAIEQARQLRPDLILMDVSMPVLDGIEATRLIKAEMPQVQIIALSMHEDTQIAESMREAGAVAFVSKASAADELLRVITRVASRQDVSFSTGLNS